MYFGTLSVGLGCFPLDHGAYPPQSDSYLFRIGIRSLIEIGTPGWGPHSFSALPPILLGKASPKAISGRTSYFQTRLEFHP